MTEQDVKIMNEAWDAMIKVNPTMQLSHTVEDFVVENFTDRCTTLGFKGDYDRLAKWFFTSRQEHAYNL